MKIAIIGAGFAGLGVGYHLAQSHLCSVTFFDAKKVGGGASGIAAGLINPYFGQHGRRSWRAQAALDETQALLKIAQNHTSDTVIAQQGILRFTYTKEQRERFLNYAKEFQDVAPLKENLFLLSSGLTVNVPHYLKGLWKACETHGTQLINEAITNLEQLQTFDLVVIAAGWGIKELIKPQAWRLQFVKGQSIICDPTSDASFERSCVAEGYFAKADILEIGATYEHEFDHDHPCEETAHQLLHEKLQFFCPQAKILSYKAGVRVTCIGQYVPFAQQIDKRTYLFTALGSRGLLYHAYFGKLLAQAILCNKMAFN